MGSENLLPWFAWGAPRVLFVLHDAIGEQASVIRAMAGATLDLISGVTLPADPLDPSTPTVLPQA